MKLQLMELRKAAGYTNRDDFARDHGIAKNTYKAHENGTRKLTIDKACEYADIFGVTLDELVGRNGPKEKADPQRVRMIRDYDQLSDAGRDAAAGAVRGILASEVARGIEGNVEDNLRERRDA